MPPETTSDGQARSFPSTQWSRLLTLQDIDHPAFEQTLNRLIEQYWKPVYHFVRTVRRLTPEDAQDHTQAFFTMLLNRRDLERLSPDRGSFRGFLKTAARNYLTSADRARAVRRPRDGARLFRFDDAEREWADDLPAVEGASPDQVFDRAWVRETLLRALDALEQELVGTGKQQSYELFRAYCIEPAGLISHAVPAEPPSYAELARRFGLGEDDVHNRLKAARQKLRELLKERVREYLGPEDSLDDELKFILS